jgi:PAS domain S-box-containing protein
MTQSESPPPDALQAELDRLRDALRERDAELRLVLDAARVGSWQWEIATGKVTWSEQLERILGLAPGSFPGTFDAFRALIHPEDRALVEAAIGQAVDRTNPYEVEFRMVPPDGKVRWIAGHGQVYRDENGVPVRMLGLSWDVSERRQLEEAGRRQEQLFRTLLERSEAHLKTTNEQLNAILAGVADGITVQDAQGRLMFANESAARLIGYRSTEALLAASRKEMLGRFRILDESGHSMPPARLPGQRALRSGVLVEEILCYQNLTSGEERWSLVRATPVPDDTGRVRFAVSTFHDVTPRKRDEARLRLLAEATAELGSSLDVQTIIEHVGRLAATWAGGFCFIHLRRPDGTLRRLAAVHADPTAQTLVDELLAGWLRHRPSDPALDDVLASSAPVFRPRVSERMLRAGAPDPRTHELLRVLAPTAHLGAPLIARGRTLGVLTLVACNGRRFDTNDLAMAEELGRRVGLAIDNAQLYAETEAALAEARAALETRAQFLSVASHELRTPLTSLKGYLELMQRRLRQQTLDERLVSGLDTAVRQVDRLTRLVGEMLDVSRLASGRFAIGAERVDVVALVARAIEGEAAFEPGRQVKVTGPIGPLYVRGDLERLDQVLVNLLQNARKYSPSDRPVTILIDESSDGVSITVRDEGIGVPPEERERIFEPFHRGGNIDPAVAGLGLGLYIAAEIVRAHGGVLDVESLPGAGSSFRLVLPRWEADQAQISPDEARA